MTQTPHDEEISVTPLELFFDLVFVFALTQVAALIRHDLTAVGVLRGILILGMVYWGWSLYTWSTNAVSTKQLGVRLGLLAAMASILLMARAIPEAFGDGAAYFAAAYFIFRIIGTIIYFAAADAAGRVALRTFMPLATTAALVALVGGFVPDEWRGWVWLVSLLIDLVSTKAAERADWHVRPGHFAERYGLLVIIALGEVIVAIGVGLAEVEIGMQAGATILVAFAGAAVLWWSYFDWVAEVMEDHLRRLTGIARGAFARDAYSILHYPLIAGIVLYAVVVEEIAVHPEEHLEGISRFLLGVAFALVLLSFVSAGYRVTKHLPLPRLVAALAVLAVSLFGAELAGLVLLGIDVALIAAMLAFEKIVWAGPLPVPLRTVDTE